MPLVEAKCTNCGAALSVDPAKDAAVCPYCGSAFIVDKAVTNYETTNNISANVMNVYGANPAATVIRAGVLEAYNGADADVTIPGNVTIIGDNAFKKCVGLRSVTIPEGVTAIGDYAFAECANLTGITIPESVAAIGTAAFSGCTSLKTITVPRSVTRMGAYVFAGCWRLETAVIYNDKISYQQFADCSALKTVSIFNDSIVIGDNAFSGCPLLDHSNLPTDKARISAHSFEDINPKDTSGNTPEILGRIIYFAILAIILFVIIRATAG